MALILTFTLAAVASANLMAIDLGTAYIKTAVARSGKGLELVTNEQAKRKTPAVVGFTEDGERLFGDAAVAFAAKKPNRVIFHARNLIGRCASAEESPPHCKPATVTIDGIGEFTGVHVVAMLLTMARKHAEAFLGNGIIIKDVAITVPSHFHSVQRAAVCDAAVVAGLKCLGVVNANTAAAVKYALDGKAKAPPVDPDAKKKKKKGKEANSHLALFYDVGASGTSASVARFILDSSKKSVSKVEVLSHASDSSLGGLALDEILVAQLADAFDKQRQGTAELKEDPRSARDLPRVMSRLRKEAQRAREILSANTERMVSVGSLHQDMDLHTKVSRAELEKTAAPLLANAVRPVLSAIQKAGITAGDLHAVVPFGGTTRMPKIQSLVLDALKRPSMNKSINSDEAAVMGAVFFGAAQSSTFRVRNLGIYDRFVRPISAEITRDPASGGLLSSGKNRSPQKVVIFDIKSALMPAKKTVSFSRNKDFEVKVFFDLDKSGSSPFSQRTLYAHLKVTGVAKVLDRFGKNPGSKKGAAKPTPRVALTFHLDASGNVRVGTAESSIDEVIITEREVPIKEKKEKKATPSAEAKESPAEAKESPAEEKDEKSDKTEEKTDDKKEEEKKKKKTRIEKREQSIVHRQTLTVKFLEAEGSIRSLSMSSADLDSAKKVLKELEAVDNERLVRAEVFNTLEGFILTERSKLSNSDEDAALLEVSTEEERNALVEQLNNAEDWMFTDEASKTEALREKHSELKKAVDVIGLRVLERTERPQAIKLMRENFGQALDSIAVIEKLHIERKSGNEKAFHDFRQTITAAEAWLDENVRSQDALSPTVDPILTVDMIAKKWDEVLVEMKKLQKLELPPAPSVEPKASAENATESEVESSGEEAKVEDAGGSKVDMGANVEAPAKEEL